MAAMSQESREALRLAAARKREKNPIAKDYAIAEWLVMTDFAKDSMAQRGFVASESDPQPDYFDNPLCFGRTFRYVDSQVVEALAGAMPSVVIAYPIGPGGKRITRVFPNNLVVELMDALRLPLDKYTRGGWDQKTIKRLRFS